MDFSVALLCVGLAAGCAMAARGSLHDLQLESYQFAGYFRSMLRHPARAFAPGLLMAAAACLCRFLLGGQFWGRCVSALLLCACGWGVMRLTAERKEKKPFVVTPRVKRLWCIMGLLFLLILLPVAWKGWRWVFPLLLPLWTALGAAAAWPLERCISDLYLRDAQSRLAARPDLIRIGITGSYGKTSVKFILNTLLSEQFQVLSTPASFNTPMGLTRVIREQLQPAHQIFLAEMGARHRGDIRELCRLVHPTHGVLTSVGPQHLDTFHSIENIRETKYDLIRAIPPEGCRFFPDDGGICRELYDRTQGSKRLASLRPGGGADVWAEDLQVSPRGSSFILCTADGRIACETRMLGEHNIQNILLAASVCLELGMNLKQISRGIGKLKPVEHRLQLISRGDGITMIDDAFNANPAGASRALRVLSAFPARRVIVTPGMVELGPEEAQYNRSFGEEMTGCVDLAILVGPKHTAPIRDGLLAKGFKEEHILTVRSLDDVPALIRQHMKPGDTVLFENDLPDNYSE